MYPHQERCRTNASFGRGCKQYSQYKGKGAVTRYIGNWASRARGQAGTASKSNLSFLSSGELHLSICSEATPADVWGCCAEALHGVVSPYRGPHFRKLTYQLRRKQLRPKQEANRKIGPSATEALGFYILVQRSKIRGFQKPWFMIGSFYSSLGPWENLKQETL